MPEQTTNYVERIMDKAIRLHQQGIPIEDWPEDLREVYDRWEIIHKLRFTHMFKGEAFIRQVYKTRFPKLNDTAIRMDMRSSELYFGRAEAGNRAYDRILQLEFCKKAQYECFQKGKYKEAFNFGKLIQNYLSPEYDPIEKPDFLALAKAMKITIEFNPELLGVERMGPDEKQALWEKVQSKMDMEVVDVEFDELPTSIEDREAENE